MFSLMDGADNSLTTINVMSVTIDLASIFRPVSILAVSRCRDSTGRYCKDRRSARKRVYWTGLGVGFVRNAQKIAQRVTESINPT